MTQKVDISQIEKPTDPTECYTLKYCCDTGRYDWALDVTPIPFGGSTAGYYAAGWAGWRPYSGGYFCPSAAAQYGIPTIEKFDFSSELPSTCVGNAQTRAFAASSGFSTTHGYMFAGDGTGGVPTTCGTPGGTVYLPSIKVAAGMGNSNAKTGIRKMPFVSEGDMTCVGDMDQNCYNRAASLVDTTNQAAFAAGGTLSSFPKVTTPNITDIHKVTFAADNCSTCTGDLAVVVGEAGGNSSSENGYASGGSNEGVVNIYSCRHKFPFADGSTISDPGNLAFARRAYGSMQVSSPTDGYLVGGSANSLFNCSTTAMQKFPFAADGDVTCIGALVACSGRGSTTTSQENGYVWGGFRGGPTTCLTDHVQKFPLSSDTPVTCIGGVHMFWLCPSYSSCTTPGRWDQATFQV